MYIKKFRIAVFLIFQTLLIAGMGQVARAEGSFQFNAQQALDNSTVVYVDILTSTETIHFSSCEPTHIEIFNTMGTPSDLSDDTSVSPSTLVNGNLLCGTEPTSIITDSYEFTPGAPGTYRVAFDTYLTVYDFSVTPNSSTNPDPTAANGRVWSYLWDLDGCGFELACATNVDLYALVPAPKPNEYIVWKLDLNRFSGASYELVANSIGLNAPYSGLSAPRSGTSVSPEYAIYLGFPAIVTQANTSIPTITSPRFIDSANEDNIFSPNGSIGVQDTGTFEFVSNVDNANYSITIDTNQDNVFGTGDRILLGKANLGLNSVVWDGNYPDATPVTNGVYKAKLQLRIGEFHFVATDVETSGGIDNVNGTETSYTRGLTIYRALNSTTNVPTYVFWDTLTSFDGQPEAESNLPNGVLSGTMTDANNNGLPDGFHTWGDFDGGGIGNTNRLDTYTYAEVATTEFVLGVANDENADNDGVEPNIEIGAPNFGDGNGDGTLDFLQNNVASIPNQVTQNTYNTLAVSGCPAVSNVNILSESQLSKNDPSFEYPLGLFSFSVNCGTPGATASVTVYYDKVYNTSSWKPRKYLNGVYIDIAGATFGTATVGGRQVTTLQYSITDGSSLDADGTANGTIVDPAGPGNVLATSTPTAPNTGFAQAGFIGSYLLMAGGLGIVSLVLRRRVKASK